MYIYFDRNGYIREIISVPVRQGTSSDDKVYAYFVPSENITDVNGRHLLPVQYNSASVNFKLADGSIETTTDDEYGAVLEIPYDDTRDLKYFEYFKEYEFVEISIPQEVLSTSGNIEATITLLGISATKVLDMFAFLIHNSVVQETVDITEPLYHRLLARVVELEPRVLYKHFITATATDGTYVDFVIYKSNNTPIVTELALRELGPLASIGLVFHGTDGTHDVDFSVSRFFRVGASDYVIIFLLEEYQTYTITIATVTDEVSAV